MKVVTASNGKEQIRLSKSDWEAIGKKAGWTREANVSDFLQGLWKDIQVQFGFGEGANPLVKDYIASLTALDPESKFSKPKARLFKDVKAMKEILSGALDSAKTCQMWVKLSLDRLSKGKGAEDLFLSGIVVITIALRQATLNFNVQREMVRDHNLLFKIYNDTESGRPLDEDAAVGALQNISDMLESLVPNLEKALSSTTTLCAEVDARGDSSGETAPSV